MSKDEGVADPDLRPVFSDNQAEHRFEATIGGSLAGVADYEETSGRLVFTHTEVQPAYRGEGVGSALARFGLDQARQQHLQVVPVCSFIRRYVERHPEHADLLGG